MAITMVLWLGLLGMFHAVCPSGRNWSCFCCIAFAAVILHDIGSKQDRKFWVDEFKDGKIDILFVYNMLLTCFKWERRNRIC